MTFMNLSLSDIRFEHISVNDTKPKSVEKANSPKQTDISSDTAELRAVPGVSSVAAAVNIGSLSKANHASAPSVSHTLPMITTNPVRVHMTIVSRNTPMDCTKP